MKAGYLGYQGWKLCTFGNGCMCGRKWWCFVKMTTLVIVLYLTRIPWMWKFMKSVHSHFNLLCVCVDVVKDCWQSLELKVQLIVELHGDSLATMHTYLNSVSLAVSLFAEVDVHVWWGSIWDLGDQVTDFIRMYGWTGCIMMVDRCALPFFWGVFVCGWIGCIITADRCALPSFVGCVCVLSN